jgi:hypothetical protein
MTGTHESEDPGAVRRSGRWRQRSAIALVVLASVFAMPAVDAVWLRNFVLETDRFVETMGPLAEDPEVQVAVIDSISASFDEVVDVQRALEDQLPPRVDFLAAPVDAAVSQFVDRQVETLVRSPKFAELWRASLRTAHDRVVTVVTGQGRLLDVDDSGVVSVDLAPVVDEVVERLEGRGLGFLPLERLEERPTEVRLLKSESLAGIRTGLRILDSLALVLPLMVVALWLVALLVGSDRRRVVLWSGAGLALAMTIHLLGLAAGRSLYLRAVADLVSAAAAGSAFDLVVLMPRSSTRILLAVGLVVAIAAWCFGPSAAATGLRAFVRRLVGAGSQEEPDRGLLAWWRSNRRPLGAAVLAVGAIRLLLADRLTWGQIVITALLVAVALAVVAVTTVPGPQSAPMQGPSGGGSQTDDAGDPATESGAVV